MKKVMTVLGTFAVPSAIFAAEPWDTVTSTMTGLTTSVSAAVGALIGLVAIFVGVKLAKRVLNKA